MTLHEDHKSLAEQGGLEQVSAVHRVASLTGIRAVAALLVVGTHAAYTTGKYTHGYFGLVCSRMEIGVPIFFVLSGFLLFRPWVRAAASGSPPPSVSRYAWHRVRRIMPAYVVTVLLAYLLYTFRAAGPNPGHSWIGLFRNLSMTQIYTDGYLFAYVHQGLTQMWSLAVEVAFYLVLPLLAYVVLVLLCRWRWQPTLLLSALVGLAAITPVWLVVVHTTDWLPDGARLWLPTYLSWFVGGMTLTVLQQMGVRCYAFAAVPLAVVSYFIVATPIAGAPTTSPNGLVEALFKAAFYTVIAALAVAPLALGDRGWYARLLATRPMVWLGEISYEIFLIHLVLMEVAMVEVLRYPVYTGSMPALFVATSAITIPLAWLLHRFTRVQGRTIEDRLCCPKSIRKGLLEQMVEQTPSHGLAGAVMKLMGAGDYRLTVTGKCEITPHYLRLSFEAGGMLTEESVHPTMWIRMWFPEQARVHQRGYTLVDPNPDVDTFDIEFALHDGVASRWAKAAQPGDTIDATVLGSKFAVPQPSPTGYVIVGDTASLPAINSLLKSIGDTPARVFLEAGYAADKQLPVARSADITWVDRENRGEALVQAVSSAAFDAGDHFGWVACDNRTTRSVVRVLQKDFGLPRKSIAARAYWMEGRTSA